MLVVGIKKIKLSHIEELRTIAIKTFQETFSVDNTEDNMSAYLEHAFSVERLSAELKDHNAEFYFAYYGDRVIGYLKINYGQSQKELKDERAIQIERIYVLQQFHGKKIGQLLLEKVIQIARERNTDYGWLGVWEENERAIQFYNRNGFVAFDKHIFKLGEDEQTDIMMKLALNIGENI